MFLTISSDLCFCFRVKSSFLAENLTRIVWRVDEGEGWKILRTTDLLQMHNHVDYFEDFMVKYTICLKNTVYERQPRGQINQQTSTKISMQALASSLFKTNAHWVDSRCTCTPALAWGGPI